MKTETKSRKNVWVNIRRRLKAYGIHRGDIFAPEMVWLNNNPLSEQEARRLLGVQRLPELNPTQYV